MPQPFTGQKKTPNKKFDTAKDNVCPNLPFLSMKDMKNTQALQGQDGSDCKLVHGNRWQRIQGNMTEKIDKSLDTYIKINETWEVHGNLTYTVGGRTVDNRHGQHFQTNWKSRLDHYVHTRTENHDQREVINQPTENVNWFQWLVEWNWQKHSTQALYYTVNGLKFEATASEISGKALAIQRIMFRNQNEPTKITWSGFKNDVGGVVNRIKASRNTAAVDHAEAEPTANVAPTAEDGVHVV